jgi:hypothetical protein
VINKRATFPFAPGKFHAATVEGGLRAGGDNCCFGDRNAGVLGKRLTLLLFACIDSKWEGRFNAGDKFGHVVVNVGLGNHSLGAANVSDKVAKGDHVETFGGVIEFHIIHITNGCRKLVACDCADNDVCVPRLALGKVGSPSGFTRRSSSGWIDGIVKRCHTRNCE